MTSLPNFKPTENDESLISSFSLLSPSSFFMISSLVVSCCWRLFLVVVFHILLLIIKLNYHPATALLAVLNTIQSSVSLRQLVFFLLGCFSLLSLWNRKDKSRELLDNLCCRSLGHLRFNYQRQAGMLHVYCSWATSYCWYNLDTNCMKYKKKMSRVINSLLCFCFCSLWIQFNSICEFRISQNCYLKDLLLLGILNYSLPLKFFLFPFHWLNVVIKKSFLTLIVQMCNSFNPI